MVRAEPGSTKYLANKMKAKGLQRLRWYCQGCERQMRDENGFKQHTLSEGHVRTMQLIGQDPQKFIKQYSSQFKSDFLLLLRTAHGEKAIQINRFYQEYIANKEHIHMNATQWNSLSEFAKYLGREGICRVTEEDDKGVFIAWINNSPEALRRQETLRRKDRQDRGDEEREKRAIEQQVRKAQQDSELGSANSTSSQTCLQERAQGDKISLCLAGKPPPAEPAASLHAQSQSQLHPDPAPDAISDPSSAVKLSLASTAPKSKNVFASAKRNLPKNNKTSVKEPPRKITQAERIMKKEIERKRKIEADSQPQKKSRLDWR